MLSGSENTHDFSESSPLSEKPEISPSPPDPFGDEQNTESGQPIPLPVFGNEEAATESTAPQFVDEDAQMLADQGGEGRTPLYKISSAEPPDWSTYTLPPLEEEEPPEEQVSGWATTWAVLREVGETIILTLIIFFVIQTFVRNFRVVGTSMIGNLHNGQYLIIDKVSYSNFIMNVVGIGGPQRGDVIVFEPPNRPDDDYVKRVIGLPGETVEIIQGQVFINGEPLDEPFQPVPGSYTTPARVIPEGQIFVLGDNRNNSNDSHTWGSLPIENIVGRAWLSYWPPSLWGTIPRDAPSEEATLKHLIEGLVPHANADETN